MNTSEQPVQEEQVQEAPIKEEITLKKKKYCCKRRKCESSEEETSSSPQEGETVTVDANEYKMFRRWRKRMMKMHRIGHCFRGPHHHRRCGMIPPPFFPREMLPHCKRGMIPPPPFCQFGMTPPPFYACGMQRGPMFW